MISFDMQLPMKFSSIANFANKAREIVRLMANLTTAVKDNYVQLSRTALDEQSDSDDELMPDGMRTILANHEDFRSEKTIVERFYLDRGHQVHFIPKFHCELNPIERVWGQAKRYTRTYTNYTLPGLRKIVEPALDFVTLDNIRKYFRKVREYERAYLEGHKTGEGVEDAIKVYKSHRRVFRESV